MSDFDLAINTGTSPETLDRLANEDVDDIVRHWVARNPNTSPETLDRLANDENSWVRVEVAYNPATPQYLKNYLKIKEFLRCYE